MKKNAHATAKLQQATKCRRHKQAEELWRGQLQVLVLIFVMQK
jgi:hypothetical protein